MKQLKLPLSIALALAAAGMAFAQERRTVPSREFTIRIDASENPAFRQLWVSRDDGRTWRPAAEAGVTVTWGAWAEGALRATVRVPQEGAYDFHAQLGDALSNRSPDPAPGQAADPRLRLLVKEPVRVPRLSWEEPRAAVEWEGGQTVQLRWFAVDPDFRERSAELAYSVDGGPWIPVAKNLDATAAYGWSVPNRDLRNLRLRVTAASRSGAQAAAVTEPIAVRQVGRAEIGKARALYDRARVLHAQNRPVEARLKYEEALAAWPEFPEVFNDLGKLHAEIKEPAKALEYFNRARELCPSNPVAFVNAARMESELGLHEEAMADLRDAVALGLDRHERAAVLAGETLWRIGRQRVLANDDAKAREAFELLLKIRHAARDTSAKARQMLEWLSTK